MWQLPIYMLPEMKNTDNSLVKLRATGVFTPGHSVFTLLSISLHISLCWGGCGLVRSVGGGRPKESPLAGFCFATAGTKITLLLSLFNVLIMKRILVCFLRRRVRSLAPSLLFLFLSLPGSFKPLIRHGFLDYCNPMKGPLAHGRIFLFVLIL